MTTSNDLPKLPYPKGTYFRQDDGYIGGGEKVETDNYTDDQMIDYGIACRKPLLAEIEKLRGLLMASQVAFSDIIEDCNKLRASFGLK